MAAGTETVEPTAPERRICRRPGCGKEVPESGRGRARSFCSDSCTRKFHNDARYEPTSAVVNEDPLAGLEPLLRQAAVMAKAAREQAEGLDPAKVRVELADAEAARRRAEAAVVTAQARQAEAESEAEALAEALDAAREDVAAAEEKASAMAGEVERVRREADERVAAVTAELGGELTVARAEASRARRDLEKAQAEAGKARTDADAEVARARQAEADARQEVQRVRDDAAREREALKASCDAQLRAQQALIEAERARAERAEEVLQQERDDRRQLTTRIASGADSRVASTARRTAKKPAHRSPAPAEAGTK